MEGITFEGVQTFIQKCPKLLEINLSGCSQFSKQEIDVINGKLEGHRQQAVRDLLSGYPDLHPDEVEPRLRAQGAGFLDAVATYRPEIESIDLTNMVDITYG